MNFDLCRRAEITLANFVNVSPTLEIDTSMERSLQVLHHGNPKIRFFSKNLKLNFDLYFNLCQRAEIVQVGLNMNLYDDIGDASSSHLVRKVFESTFRNRFCLYHDLQTNSWTLFLS